MRYWDPFEKFTKELKQEKVLGILLKQLFLEPVSDIDQGRFMVAPVDEYPLRINEFVQQQ